MFDTKTELLERIRLGESSFLEFKEVKFKGKKIEGPHRNSLADGLSAFANSRGGVFVLGVADSTREVVCSLLARCPMPDEPWLATPRQHMMERRGEGMPIILDNSAALSGKEPKIELFDDSELRLTIYAAQGDAKQ